MEIAVLDNAEGSAQGVLFGVTVTADVLLQSIRFGSLRDYSGDLTRSQIPIPSLHMHL